MAETTVETLGNRAINIDKQVDAALAPSTAPSGTTSDKLRTGPGPVVNSPVRGTTNPESRLPDTEGVFHKIVRRFKGEGPQ